MSRPIRSSAPVPNLLRALVVLAGIFGVSGAAHAQSCAVQGDAAVRCRLVLSRPRIYTVKATARLVGRDRRAAHLAITVNGRACRGPWYSWGHGVMAQCRVTFPATTSIVDASVYDRGVLHTRGVAVTLVPDGRLSALPREAGDLYPKAKPRPYRSAVRRLLHEAKHDQPPPTENG
jgi:hypothetical protein